MPAAHRPHWPPCRSAAPTQSKRSRGFRCTRTGQRLLMPKLRPLELSDTALEPRRAHGQRRRGASAQRWRGAHSVAAAGAAGRFCSELTLRSELPPTSTYLRFARRSPSGLLGLRVVAGGAPVRGARRARSAPKRPRLAGGR
jgi:hypothetical protein